MRARLNYSNVIATIAVFVALGGTGYAAVKLSKGQVKGKHLAKNAITSKKIKNQSLLARDFRPGQIPAGPTGPRGNQGQTGERGPRGDEFTLQTTLRSGETLTGTWGGWAGNGVPFFGGAVQFRIPLAEPIPADRWWLVNAPNEDCPGAGEADPGWLCVYETDFLNRSGGTGVRNPETGEGGASRDGFVWNIGTTGTTAYSYGTWAVTAP